MGCCRSLKRLAKKITRKLKRAAKRFYNFVKKVAHEILEEAFSVLGIEGEDVYPIEVVTNRLIPDEQKDSLPLAVLAAIRQDDSIIDRIKHSILTGPVTSANRYTQYGKSTYTYGLPEVVMQYKELDDIAVTAVLDSIYGEPTQILVSELGQTSEELWVKFYLQENEGYSEEEQIITHLAEDWFFDYWEISGVTDNFIIHVTHPVHGDDILPYEITYPSEDVRYGAKFILNRQYISGHAALIGNSFLTISGSVTTPAIVSLEGKGQLIADTGTYGFVNCAGTSSLTTTAQKTAPGSISLSGTGIMRARPQFSLYWVYLRSLETYPTLNVPDDTVGTGDLDMFPIVPLRKNFVSVNSAPESPEYLTSKEILNIIGIPIEDVIDTIEDRTPTELAQISDAFILFALNLYSTSREGKRCLYQLFDNLALNAAMTKEKFEASPGGQTKKFNLMTVKEQAYNTVMAFSWITQEEYAGVIGELDEITTSVEITPEIPVTFEQTSDFVLKHQFSETHYEETRIHGLHMITVIKTTAGSFKSKITKLSASDEAERSDFVIPLSYGFFDEFPYTEKERLLYESLTLVIYASDHVYLEYYETASFANLLGVVLKIISLVILYLSWGAAKDASAFLWAIAEQLLVQAVFVYALEQLLIAAGDDQSKRYAAYMLYIIASSMYGSKRGGGLSFAEELVMGIQLVTDAIVMETAMLTNELQREMESWTEDMTERQEELEKAKDLLSDSIDPNDISSFMPTNMSPYDTPSSFIDRCIHNSNPGVAVLDQIGIYHANALQLPEAKGNTPTIPSYLS